MHPQCLTLIRLHDALKKRLVGANLPDFKITHLLTGRRSAIPPSCQLEQQLHNALLAFFCLLLFRRRSKNSLFSKESRTNPWLHIGSGWNWNRMIWKIEETWIECKGGGRRRHISVFHKIRWSLRKVVCIRGQRVCGAGGRCVWWWTPACHISWHRIGPLSTLLKGFNHKMRLWFGIQTPKRSLTRLFLPSWDANEVAIQGKIVPNRILKKWE